MKRFLLVIFGLCACGGPALRDQQALERLSHQATLRCLAAKGADKKTICVGAKGCVTSIKHAVDSIQMAQEAREKGQPDSDLDVAASGFVVGARAACKEWGFQ
jgi:hypothetical protein